MTSDQYNDIVTLLADVRHNIMDKEMADVGWDLRDELLALQETVSLLAKVCSGIEPPIQRRPCEINSNQFYMKGWWHGWSHQGGKMYAVVEGEGGDVRSYDIGGCYSLKFTDTKETH